MSSASQLLPALRTELSLLPAPKGDDGTPRWFLFDPVKNAFHVLTRQAVKILKDWREETPQAALTRLKKSDPDSAINEDTLKDIAQFLYQHNLTQAPPAGQADIFARQEAKSKKPFHERIMHSSLFFRIPLFDPHKFLTTAAPFVRFLFTPQSWICIALIGLIGLIFTARQWDQFLATFIYFFTPQGFLFYALTLTGVKILHELGHAFTAHHFGARVPIMGVAFLLMFPVLYTDTTDAWRLTSRRKRALIDAGGMIAEFAIACAAIFLWSFLPDGPARSAAFFTATTSFGLSLLVNLNPCMRFDGYYLLADIFGFQNMQASGFNLGRWKLRETLWGLGRTKPFTMPRHKERILLVYAYVTWTYRLFLFTAIGLFLYHILPKPFGSLFFIFIVMSFIAAPLWRELKHWRSLGRALLLKRRAYFTLLLGCFALCAFFLPWQTHVTVPALMRPATQTDIFPITAARIDHIHVKNGDDVLKGDILVTLSSEELIFRQTQSSSRANQLKAQINQQAAQINDRQWISIWREELAKETTQLRALDEDISKLTLYAPHDGIITALPAQLHDGRYIRKTDRLLRVSSPLAQELVAFPKEKDIYRLTEHTAFVFISDDALAPKITGRITALPPTGEAIISDRLLTSLADGPLAVNVNEKDQLIAQTPVFKLRGTSTDGDHLTRTQRGMVTLEASPQSPASVLWRSVMRVLIRETGF
ncbi:biotin/lipoyl-binding protein [Hellea sp.]|nr:biotin/lipoyl-binding protein [Hellea sp.]